jgi:Mn-containing catalase
VHKLQELLGGACGEMAIAMRYLFQAWNCRMPGKCKDLIIDIATEEMGHVEMIATMVARLLEGAPATATTKAAAADPVVGRGCLPYSTRLMRASWAGNCALPPFPASLLFDSYLHSCLPRFRSDRLTVLP